MSIWNQIRDGLAFRFNLNEDKGDEAAIVASISRGILFRGTNLWALIFAIFVASIGLNVNSTAVIIGAMLISPLMGPIMGVGLGIGINDLSLMKRGFKNLVIATAISIATSTVYFFLTPLQDAQSELLARTSPSIWDVLIAFFGGLAGIVAGTRKEKSNVVPGVAIATALMPPLCTAGYGLATANWYYFFGALYLYFINSVFICFATYLMVRYMNFHKKEFPDKGYERRVQRYIWLIVTVTLLPSIYLAYRIVDKSLFERRAKQFVSKELVFAETQVVSRNLKYSTGKREIDVLLIGREVPQIKLDSIRQRLPQYQLDSTVLVVRQGLNAKNEIDLNQIRASVLEAVYARDTAAAPTAEPEKPKLPDLTNELRALFPLMKTYSVSQTTVHDLADNRADTVTMVVTSFGRPVPTAERTRVQNWLRERLQADSVVLVIR